VSDPLLAWRGEFPILDTCTYLVSHSLGAMPRGAEQQAQTFVDGWRTRGVRAWAEGWWETGRHTAALLEPLLAAEPGTISMTQNVSVAQSLIASAHDFTSSRNRIVVSALDFPTNMYVFEAWRRHGAEVVYVPSPDNLTAPADTWMPYIDDRTALVCCSLVLFRTSAVVDVAPILERAHAVGARVILDVYQATGTLPLDVRALGVDFAVGGSVKWLCGGPGAGYLYVRPDLAAGLQPAVTGWAGHARPFAFEPGAIAPAEGSERFETGTPNVAPWMMAQAGYRVVADVGIARIRAKSLRQTQHIIEYVRNRGWHVRTPLRGQARGGTVTIDVPDSAAVAAELLRREVIIDHRPQAGIRMAPHFYTSDEEIEHALHTLTAITS
jgi:kynureninase